MNVLVLITVLIFAMVILRYMSIETFRGGRGRGRGGGRWRGGGWRGRGFNPHRYLRRFRRRRGWFPYWNNTVVWPATWAYNYVPCNCKRGCTPDGCAFPGYGPNDCV